MSERVPLPNIAGLVGGFVDVDLFAGHFEQPARIVGFQPSLTDPPSGGSVSVDIRTAAAGGGEGLSAVIPDGARSPAAPVTGSIDVPADTTVYMRVTAATGGALGLYGQFLVEQGAAAASALTTLALVKEYIGETTTDEDAVINRIIGSVSLKMQRVMRRRILSELVIGEKKSVNSLRLESLLLEVYPVQSGSVALTVSETLLDAVDFDVEENSGQVFYTPGGSGCSSFWPQGRRHISVDYQGGFDSIPADLEHAATVQAAWEFKRKGRLGDRTQVIGDNTATLLVDAWAPDVVPVLESYRERLF